VSRLWGGAALIALALFMLVGFFGSNVPFGGAALFALLLLVGVPGAWGISLLLGHRRRGEKFQQRREALRSQTLGAEILKLAGAQQGKLTVAEIVRDLAVTPDAATAALNELHLQELADIEITEDGVLVYVFADVKRIEDKLSSRDVLE
jgi:predicted DNA-binding transcriptional regulator